MDAVDIDRGGDHELFEPASAEHVPATARHHVVGPVEKAADGLGDGEPP
ncbi:hypothetical protein ACWGR4_46145 [Embleya sp. NPDC055664]